MRGPTVSKRSCYNCKHLYRDEESWEMPHIFTYECNARPHNSMLAQFPFKNTRCAVWEKLDSSRRLTFVKMEADDG